MFRAVRPSSSGAPLYLQPLVYIRMWWPPVVKSEWQLQTGLRAVATCVCKPEAVDTVELLMMSDVPLETCWAFNELRNNKFRYQVASCWLLLLSHTTMHGSMNIKYVRMFQSMRKGWAPHVARTEERNTFNIVVWGQNRTCTATYRLT